MTKAEFIKKVKPIIEEVAKENNYSEVMIDTCLAQACLESGFGSSTLMMKANALFGIKASKSWKGKVFNAKTKECYDGKNLTTINDCFRAYNSIRESVEDYFKLMKLARYKACYNAKTVEEAITIIKNGGYATAVNYVSSVLSVHNYIKNLNVTTATKVNNDEEEYIRLARDVIKGKYGNGRERMFLLGSKYARVQYYVNQIMKGAIK